MFLTWRAARLHRFVFAIFAATVSFTLQAKITCSVALKAAAPDPIHAQIFGTRETWLREEVIPEIQYHSRSTENKIRKYNKAGYPVHYDYVIVGSGPHGAQMALSLKQTHPNASILIVEAKDAPGVFAQYSGSFSINTGREGTNISGGAVT